MQVLAFRSLARRASLTHVWLCLPPILGFILLCLAPLREGDLWWHIKAGELMALGRTIPATDVSSFTAYGYPYFFASSWLSDLLFYLLTIVGSLPMLVLCQAIVGAAIAGLLLLGGLERGASAPVAASLALLGWLILYPFSTARPQMFSFFFFALFFALLSGYRSGNRGRLWLLPVLMIIWCNLHGAWVMGLLLLGASVGLGALEWAVDRTGRRPLRPLIAWSVATALATLVNPTGLGIHKYLFTMGGSAISQMFVSEWQPPLLTQTFAWPFFASLALILVSLAYSKRRPALYDFGLMLVFLVLALRYLRMVPFFAIVATPLLAGWLASLADIVPWAQRPSAASSKPTLNVLALLMLLLSAFLAVPQVRLSFMGDPETTLIANNLPIGASNYLARQAQPGARLFNMPEWGGFLIWRLSPTAKVFVDGRIELYPLDVWRDYLQIAQTIDGWQDRLESYQVDYLVLDRTRHEQLIALAPESGWERVYQDSVAVIFAHGGLSATAQKVGY